MIYLFLFYLPVQPELYFFPSWVVEKMRYTLLKAAGQSVNIALKGGSSNSVTTCKTKKLTWESWRELGDWSISLEKCQCAVSPSPHAKEEGVCV